MSRFILNKIRYCSNSLFLNNNQLLLQTINKNNFLLKYNYSEKNNDEKNGHTILVQNGVDIQELPVIIRKACGLPEICDNNKLLDTSLILLQSDDDTNEILKMINKCMTSHGVLCILDSIDSVQLSPNIAYKGIEKICRIENLFNLKNMEELKIIQKMIQCIIEKGDNQLLLNTLELMKNFTELTKIIELLSEEILIRSDDGKMNLDEIIDAIEKLNSCKMSKFIDKFWTGLSDQDKHITSENIHHVYGILSKTQMSRKMLINMLERRITDVWWKLKTTTVIDILESLINIKQSPYRTMQSLSRWLNTNIHAINEINLEQIIKKISYLEYTDGQIEKSLERYIKAKGIKIKQQLLIVTILEYCCIFRLRNVHILNGCSEFFIINSTNIEPKYIKSIIFAYGLLNYQPLNGIKFWQTLEIIIENNFGKINSTDIIDIMLSCTYLEKYPLNFVKYIFNPYFLDIMHQQTINNNVKLQKLRSNLKLFDTALTLECFHYNGPMLPKDLISKCLWHDGRIKRIINQLIDEINIIAGGNENYTNFVILSQLPVNELYIIDILLHPPRMGSQLLSSINIKKSDNKNLHTAILIHLPEHFNSTGEYLNGQQMMRIRHFRLLGMKVVTLKYDKLIKLKVHPKELNTYFVERMKLALPAI